MGAFLAAREWMNVFLGCTSSRTWILGNMCGYVGPDRNANCLCIRGQWQEVAAIIESMIS